MKTVFVSMGFVVGVAATSHPGATVSGPTGSIAYELVDSDPAQVGWACTVTDGIPVFTAPANYVSNIVSIGPFLASITTAERVALRASVDELVKEFVTMCVDPRITEIDLNLPVTQFDIKYAAGLVAAPAGAPNAGNNIQSVCIGLNGDGVTRAAAILSGNPLAATS